MGIAKETAALPSAARIVDHRNGLVTVGLGVESDQVSAAAHQSFLAHHKLDYWRLVILQVVTTPHIFVLSAAGLGDGEASDRTLPNHTLTDAPALGKRLAEILEAHFEQLSQHVSPSAAA